MSSAGIEEASGQADETPYLPGAEPAGGTAPEPFGQLGAVTGPALGALRRTVDAATRSGRTAIGAGDVVLGLLEQPRAAATGILAALSVEQDEVRTLVEAEIGRDRPAVVLTLPVETVVRRAADNAQRLAEAAVGTDHLLLALASESGSSAMVALDRLGISAEAIRRQIAVLLRPPSDEDEPS
jgi:ATP-dependent Clp protease ATP-binding subunit ClpC